MKFISVRNFRNHSTKIWEELSQHNKEMVITSNGKPVAILSPTSEDNLEFSLSILRRAKALEAIESVQRASLEEHKEHSLSLKDINQEIKSVRRRLNP